MLKVGVFKLPNLFRVSGYNVFFWSHESNEPIHVHISKGKSGENSTKIWLTKSGGCIVANNMGRISDKDLKELMDIISAQYFVILSKKVLLSPFLI